jgi:hypothetical protein
LGVAFDQNHKQHDKDETANDACKPQEQERLGMDHTPYDNDRDQEQRRRGSVHRFTAGIPCHVAVREKIFRIAREH